MPSFSSPTPPISTRLAEDPRPLAGAQAPLTTAPLAYKASPVLIPPKTPPATRADSVPPAANVKELVGSNPPNEIIDREVFDQVLELDDDEELFSKDMVDAYFIQADKTFNDMDAALTQKNLPELSSLGHFLKGSSAALGVSKVQLSCEHIQHYGHLKEGTENLTETEAIGKITRSVARAREEYREAKKWLESFYTSYKVQTES